jgi:hypothetical protein
MQDTTERTDRPKVFLSHSSQDKEFTDRLVVDLEKAGVDVWYDRWEIRAGDSIVSKINAGLKDSDYVLVVISPNSVGSPWVTLEINAALIESLGNRSSYLLPVLLADTDLPPVLRDRRYADFRRDYEGGLREVLDVLVQEDTPVARGEEIPPDVPCGLWGVDRGELRRRLNAGLAMREVKTICFDLELDFDNFAGDTKNDKIMELILFLVRRAQLPRLIEWITRNRRDLC